MEVRLMPHDEEAVAVSLHEDREEKAKLFTASGYEACRILVNEFSFKSILAIGSTKDQYVDLFRAAGKKVTAIDASFDADFIGGYVTTKLPSQYDAIWCCHVLEHQRNVGAFLDKIYDDLCEDGVLAITVPPVTNHWISSGHCSWFNGGMLLYHLVMAGFNCRTARVLTYRYNVSVILRKRPTGRPRSNSAPQLEEIAEFLPDQLIRDHGMNGAILQYRTEPRLAPNPHPAACIDYSAGEIRYLIEVGRVEDASAVLSDSLVFNPLDENLLALQTELRSAREASS